MIRWFMVMSAGLGACAGLVVEPPEQCAEACELAAQCGFLPSTLGFGATTALAQADCLRLCDQSPADREGVAAVVECLTTTGDKGWCGESESDRQELGMRCAAAVTCLDSVEPDAAVFGPVSLAVTVVTFDEFAVEFGVDELLALYGDPSARPRCAPALCDQTACQAVKNTDEVDLAACDPRMCGKDSFQFGKLCEKLAASAIEVMAGQGESYAASQVLFDAASSDACKISTAVFEAEEYSLRPGPVRTTVRVAGVLAKSELMRIGHEVPPEAEDDELIEYCLRFPGMNVLARSGMNRLVVPVGDVDAIYNYLVEGGVKPAACKDG